MNRSEFEQALSRRGGDLARWPAAERREAEALMASDAQAAALHAQAVRLDGLLGEAMRPVPVDAATIGRIVSGIEAGGASGLTLQPTRRLVAWAGAAMVASLVIGFAVGVAVPVTDGEDALAGLVFGASATSDSESVL